MKKIAGMFLVGLASVGLAFGIQVDPKMVLDKMSETYKAMPGFEIEFVQRVLSESEVMDRMSGSVSVAKNEFLVKFPEQHIYSNGQVLWTYLPGDQELTISNFDPEENVINPSNIYDIYKEGFEYESRGTENVGGELCDVIQLTSTDPDSDFTAVTMYISQKTNYLRAWDMEDYDGIKTSFEVSKFTPDRTFPEGYFVFDDQKNPVAFTTDLRN